VGRSPVDRARVGRFLQELGTRYRGRGRLYLVGGAEMVFLGFREQTEDIDYTVELEGDSQEFTGVLRSLIRDLDVSLEPAGPGDFIPLPKGWQDRSRHVGRFGHLDVFAMDPVATVLSKVERGLSRDIGDALALVKSGMADVTDLSAAFDDVAARLERESVRVDEADFRRKYEAFLAQLDL